MFNAREPADTGPRLRALRRRFGLSIRALARGADVSAAMISYAERGLSSLSLVTLQKLLAALGTSLTEFFSGGDADGHGPVFPREQMRAVTGEERTYTILLGRRPGVQLEMFDEQIRPSRRKPEHATLKCDIAGYILAGTLTLEIEGEKRRRLRPGDAFYLPRGVSHRGYASGKGEVRLITVSCPASYPPSRHPSPTDPPR